MEITSIKYVNDEQTSLNVNDGEMFVPWPCNTWHNEFIQEWLAALNIIDPFQTFAEAKEAKRQEINQWRNNAMGTLTVDYNSITYDADAQSRENINGTITAINSGVTVPDPLTWRAADNTDQSLPHVQLIALSGLMFNAVNDIYANSWAKKAAVDAAIDQAVLDAIVW